MANEMQAVPITKAEMAMQNMGMVFTPKGECSYKKGVAIDVDDAVEHGKDLVLDVDLMVNLMKKKLDSTPGKPSYRSTIFRVPEDIRNNDAAAYTPKVVSIGLLHQEKRRLDEHKWHYLDKVLSRSQNNLKTYTKEMALQTYTKEMALKTYTEEMANIVVKAGFCCSGRPEPGGMEDSVEIMLVDGCFIVNLLLQLEDNGPAEINDPIYSDRWTLPWVAHDMLLLENQLPFFVLEKLWELTGCERPALKKKVLRFFGNLLREEENDLETEDVYHLLPETEDVYHLLHLIHLSLQPASSIKKPESTSGTTIPGPPQSGDTLSSTKNSSESPESLQPTSPAMTSQPVNVPRLKGRANLMPHDPTPSGLKQTPPGLKQIPRAQQIKPESTGGTTIPNPPQTIDTLSSTKNSSFERSKPLQPPSPTEKPESASGATIPSPPQPSDTLSTSKSSPFISTESLQPTSRARISQSAPSPHDKFPFPSGSASSPHDEFSGSALLPHDEFPIPSGSASSPHDEFSESASLPDSGLRGAALLPHGEIPRAQQMSEPRPAPRPKTSPSATEPQNAGVKFRRMPKTIPSATELQNAGVKFRRIKKDRSFLDVTFEQGEMKMPRLTISDSTNSLFRNFIAFEQGFPDCGSYFTSYCIFMDSLINTAKDVEILKRAGIIEHVLGSDKEVAFLFNKLCKGTTWDYKNSYLRNVFKDVEDHTQKRWPTWRAKLVRDYFSNPWAILSSAAAIFVIILAIGQTILAFFSYFRPHGPNSIVSGHEIISPAIRNSFWI